MENKPNSPGTLSESWVKSNAMIFVSLAAFLYSMWDFLVGRHYFSQDFYHIHLVFENAYKALDKNFFIPTWLSFFQGGKATFGEMANIYFPFGIDFIFTYVFSKLLGLDQSIGLVLIDTWRMVLLNIFFAFGVRQFSKEILESPMSVDLAFLISLFIGGGFLTHMPIVVMCNIFSPWILLYLTRMITHAPERVLHNGAGLTLFVSANLFHQSNIESSIIWPFILFYAAGLIRYFSGETLFGSLRSQLSLWRVRFGMALFIVVIALSIFPKIWASSYLEDNDVILQQKENQLQSVMIERVEDSIDFGWPNPITLINPFPNIFEKPNTIAGGVEGKRYYKYQYYGMLGFIFMLIGVVYGQNRFNPPILIAVFYYILYSLVIDSPVFSVVLKNGSPEIPNIQFAFLHLTPLLCVLVGIGVDRVLKLKSLTDLRVSLLTPALVARGVYPYLLQAFRKLVTLVRPAKIYVSTKRLFKFIFDGLSKVAGDSKLASSCKSVFRKVFAGKSDNKGFSFFKNVFQKPFEWMIQKITPFFKFIWKPLRWLILGSILFFKFLFKKFLKGLKILVDPSSLKSEVFQVLAVLFFSLLLIVGLSWAMMVDTGFGTFHQGKLFSLVFIFLSMLSIIWALEMPEAKQRIRLFVVVILLDFFTFHHMVQTVTVASTEDFQPKEHAQAGKKDIPAPDLSATDNFNLFSPDQFGSYAPWDESQLYHPDKIKYPTLGNQSFYELKSNSTPEVHNMVSGVTLPRLFLADFAVEDPSEEITRRVFHDPSTSSHLGNIIYLNEKISQGRDLLIEEERIKTMVLNPRLKVNQVLGYHEINSSMLQTNLSVGIDLLAGLLEGEDFPPDTIESRRLLDPGGVGWVQIDFGSGSEQIINLVRMSQTVPFSGRNTFLNGSHDSVNWLQVGDLSFKAKNPNSKLWNTQNREKFRFYRIVIHAGSQPVTLKNLPTMELGFSGRVPEQKSPRNYSKKIPLLRFVNEGLTPDKKYYIFSYYFSRSDGTHLSTSPSQRFGFKYNLNWIPKVDGRGQLKPTWKNDWRSNDLFQIGYKRDGLLSINIPAEKILKYRKHILELSIDSVDNGVKVLDYGPGRLRVMVNQAKGNWLYFADSWDKYWQARINEKPAHVIKANLQFKAIFVPKDKQIIELFHNPTPYFNLIKLAYVFQALLILVFILTSPWIAGLQEPRR